MPYAISTTPCDVGGPLEGSRADDRAAVAMHDEEAERPGVGFRRGSKAVEPGWGDLSGRHEFAEPVRDPHPEPFLEPANVGHEPQQSVRAGPEATEGGRFPKASEPVKS
jgi:hypothetical protein